MLQKKAGYKLKKENVIIELINPADIKVKNNHGSLLIYWSVKASIPAVFCSEASCVCMKKLQGTIVKKEDSEKTYVIPLCEDHHNISGKIEVNNYTKFIEIEIED